MATEQYFNILTPIPSGPTALLGSSDASTSSTSDSEISMLARVELGDGRFTIKGRINEVVQKTE